MSSIPPARPFRFAVQGGPFGSATDLREHARRVEALGYEELYTSDHIGAQGSSGRAGGMIVVDPFIPLVVAAEATEGLRVGPLVLNTEFYNPALLARTAATTDRLTDGRLVLGLGTGYAAAEHDAIGRPIRPPGPRVTRFGETLRVLRELLDQGTADHHGTHENVSLDDLGVAPLQDRIPFLVGGHGRRVVELAARYADIFQFTGLTHDADGTPAAGGFAIDDLMTRAAWLDNAAGERGLAIERSALVQFVACGEAAPSAEALADGYGLDAKVIEHSPFVLSGTLRALVEKLERLRRQLGITHYVVRDADEFAPVVESLARST